MTTVIEQLEALAEKASDRPWKSVSGYGAIVTDGASGYHMSEEDRAAYGGGLIGESMPAADRDFIVAVVNALPDLLALATAAEAQDRVNRMGVATWTLSAAAQAKRDLSDALARLRKEVPA